MRTIVVSILSAMCCVAEDGGSFLNRHIPFDQARRWQGLSMRPAAPVLVATKPARPVESRCGHILVFVPLRDQDRGIVAGKLGQGRSNMPSITPMPVCEADVRAAAGDGR